MSEGLKRGKFSSYPIGYFHVDLAEVRTEQGKLYMFVAIDRTSKFAFVELHEQAKTATSRDFLLRLIEAVSYKIHTILTDNGIHFATPRAKSDRIESLVYSWGGKSDSPCVLDEDAGMHGEILIRRFARSRNSGG